MPDGKLCDGGVKFLKKVRRGVSNQLFKAKNQGPMPFSVYSKGKDAILYLPGLAGACSDQRTLKRNICNEIYALTDEYFAKLSADTIFTTFSIL